MNYLSVKDWERFQVYKDRNPPWIRLYTALLEDYHFAALGDVEKCHLLLVWILASRMGNRVPHDNRWVQQKIQAHEPVDLDSLVDGGWLIPHTEAEALGKREQWASRYVSAETRARVLARDGHQCRECGATKNLEIDHIVPVSRGGTGDEGNLQTLCRPCNRRKRSRCADGATQGSEATEQGSGHSVPQSRDRERDRAEGEPSDATPSGVNARETWITPFAVAWQERYDGEMPIAPALRPLRKLIRSSNPPEVLRRWRLYLAATDGSFATPSRFASTWGKWATAESANASNGYRPGIANRVFAKGMDALRDEP